MNKEEKDALVSIIVPTYNSAGTIGETLDSLFHQTYENIELIISDDKSVDATIEIVKDWLSTYGNRFRNTLILENDVNQGVVKNLNKAIGESNGNYIKIVAGDDMLLPKAIELSMDHLFLYPEKINFYKVEIFGENRRLNRNMQRFCDRGYKILNSTQQKMYRELLKDNYIAGPSWGVIPKKVFDSIGLFDERYPMLEDYPFLIRLKQYHYEFVLLDRTLAKYRISGSSLCHGESRFKESWISFEMLEKEKLLIQEKMYYTLFKDKIDIFRYKLRRKYGTRSFMYLWSYSLYIFMPRILMKSIRARL